MSTSNEAGTFTIELPESLLTPFGGTPEAFARELRLAAAIRWLRLGRISPEQAAEVAGLERAEFDAALSEGARGPRAETVPPARPFASAEAESHYQALGRFKGPLAAKDVQRAAREFWRGSGVAGARWLVGRLRDEFQVEVMHAAASALASIEEASLGPIFEALSESPPVDQAQVLLWALVSLAQSKPSIHAEGAQPEIVLVEFLQHDEPDLRESAARALRLLRRDRALRWLSHRLRDESDAEVRRTIEDELAWHRTGQS
jgi:hypothetical protein